MQYILVIFVALILYRLQTTFYKNHWTDGLFVQICYDKPYAEEGEKLELTQIVENRKLLPLSVLYVKFYTSRTFQFEEKENITLSDHTYRNDVFSILGNQKIIRKHNFRTTKRGYYSIPSVELVSSDLFMQKSFATIMDNHEALYVYPSLLRDRNSLAILSSVMGTITKKSLFEDPLSFQGIREYQNGDSMRYINWKATARTEELMVNTYNSTLNSEIILLVNLDTNIIQRSDHLQEYIIRVAATMLDRFITYGAATKVAINLIQPSTDNYWITDLGKGEEHRHLLMQTLAQLDLSKGLTDYLSFFQNNETIFCKAEKNVVYVVLSNYRKDSLLTAYEQKQRDGYQMVFVCPEYSNHITAQKGIQYWEVTPDEL